jgi:hypothetical protein
MTSQRAIEILFDFWGSGEPITPEVVKEIEMCQESGASALETVAKQAGIWDTIKRVKSFDNARIRSIVSHAKALSDIKIANKPWLR